MTRRWIVVGDKLAGGGVVVSGSLFTDINGFQVARVGDKAICSLHGPTTIASGDPTIIIDGSPVARERDCCACGCKLISTRQFSTFIEDMHGDGGSQSFAVAAGIAASSVSSAADVAPSAEQLTPTNFNAGDDAPSLTKARDAVQDANEALRAAGAYREYNTELEAAQAWRKQVLPVADAHGVEIGALISEREGQYHLGGAYSAGAYDNCNGLLESGTHTAGEVTAYIHTHPEPGGWVGADRAFSASDQIGTDLTGGHLKGGGDISGDLVSAFFVKKNAYIADSAGLHFWNYSAYADSVKYSLAPVRLGESLRTFP